MPVFRKDRAPTKKQRDKMKSRHPLVPAETGIQLIHCIKANSRGSRLRGNERSIPEFDRIALP
jgi:hypothetical protein